jgi:C4-dicarboxylate-specific signal transduction histidine kinase
VNLFQNARESMFEAPASQCRLTVRLRRPSSGHVRFEVEDDGTGILPENLERVFTHGFTTKKDGHGFGLHASANAAKEMGGSLLAQSRGAGRGAIFALELPVREFPRVPAVGARP